MDAWNDAVKAASEHPEEEGHRKVAGKLARPSYSQGPQEEAVMHDTCRPK
jgi:hypothetical protein